MLRLNFPSVFFSANVTEDVPSVFFSANVIEDTNLPEYIYRQVSL